MCRKGITIIITEASVSVSREQSPYADEMTGEDAGRDNARVCYSIQLVKWWVMIIELEQVMDDNNCEHIIICVEYQTQW